MAISVASLTASLNLDSSQFQTGLNSASGSLSKFASGAQGHAASVEGAMGGISAKAVALGGVMANVATGAIGALAGAFGNLKSGLIDGNAEFERYQTQFGVLLGSAGAAKDRLQELAQFGASTPFELPEVVRADKILQAFGLHSTETAQKFGMSGKEIRTVAGDVAAGTGASFEEISTYLGKFSSGATGEAIARMQELGITTRAELASMGVAFSKSGEMTSPVEVGMSALLQVMQTKFGGMMDAQSSTFEGMMSNLNDWTAGAMRLMGQPIFDALKGQLGNLLQVLNSGQVQAAITNIGSAIGGMVSGGISALQNLASSLAPFASALQGVFNIVSNGGGFIGNFDAWADGLDAAFGSDTANKIISFGATLASLVGDARFYAQALLAAAQGQESFGAVLGPVGDVLDGLRDTLSSVATEARFYGQALLAAAQGQESFGAILGPVGDALDAARDAIGNAIGNIVSAIQGGVGRVQTAIQSFQAGMAQGTPGAAVAGLLSALGIPDDLAGQIGAKVAEVNTAIQTAKSNLGTAIQSFVSGWQQGTPGAAVAGFLSSMGISEDVAGKVGSIVGGIAQAVQNAKTTLQNAIQGFQSGGVAGGATALLQSLGLDTSIVGQAQTVLGNIASAIKDGVQRVKDAVSAAMSGGGVSGVLAALGLDPAIASQAQTLFNTVVSAVQSGIGRIKDAISAAVGGGGAAGVLHALGLSDETVGLIMGVVSRIGAVVGVLVQNFQAGFQQAAAALAPVIPPLLQLASTVGTILVGAFVGLVGFVAGALPGLANVVTGVVNVANGALQLLVSFVTGMVSIIANLLTGNWAGAWQAAGNMVQAMNDRAREIMLGLQQAAVGIFQALIGGIISAFQTLYAGVTGEQLPNLVNAVAGKFEELKASAVAKVSELKDQVVTRVQELVDQGRAVLTNAVDSWAQAGRGLVNAMADGIKSAAQGVIDSVRNMVQKARDLLPGSDAKEGPLSDLTASGAALGATFGAGMMTTLPDVVTRVRAVMEQVGQVLKGVGDAVSMSDWEDLAGPVGQMADMVKALADVGATLAKGDAARNWEAARGQVASLVASARAMMTDLASIVKGVGDVVSTSDWEDLVGPLKLLADGIAAVTSAVTNTAQAVKVMQEALTVNWVKLDVATLTAGLSQITSTGVQLLQAALDATASMKTLTEQGLAPLKLSADGVGAAASLVSSALDVTRGLFEFASNVILRTIAQSVGARAYFAALATDITKLGAAIVDGFTRAAISVGQPVVDATKRFADAAGNLNTGITSTIALVNTLVVLLRRGMPEVNADELATQFVGPLVRLGVTLSTAANSAAQSLTGLDTTGLDKLKNVIGGLLDTFKGIVDLVDYLLGGEMQAGLGRLSAVVQETQRMFDAMGLVDITVTAEDVLRQLLDPILALGRALTQIVAQGTEALSGLDTSGYDKLASVMGNAQDTLKKIMDLSDFVLDMLENGGLFEAATRVQAILAELNTRLAGLGMGPTNVKELLRQMLDPILALGVALAEVAAEATASLSNLNTGGLSKLNEAVGGLQAALENIPKLVKQIIDALRRGYPTVDPQQVATNLFNPLFALAIALVRGANTAAAGIKDVATGAIEKLSSAIGTVLGAVKDTLDLLKLLNTTLANGPIALPDTLHEELVGFLTDYAALLAQAFLTSANAFEGQVEDAAKELQAAFNAALGVAKDALDTLKLFGEALTNGPIALPDTLHAELMGFLTDYAALLADAFLSSANGFTGQVEDAAKELQAAISGAVSVAKSALEVLKLFGEALANGPIPLPDTLHAELMGFLTDYAALLASAFLASANAFTGKVGEGAKQLQEAIGGAVSVAKDALDLLKLFGEALANGPIPLPDTLHEELVGFLTDYAALLASAYLASANAFTGKVGEGAKALQDAIGGAVSVAKNALDLLKLFGEALANGPIPMPDTLHEELVGFLTDYASLLASAFLTSANAFTGKVGEGAKQLQDAIGGAVSVAKNALDLLKLFGEALANGPIPLPDTLHAELMGFLTDYAALLADAYLVSANAFKGKVGDGAKALQDAIGGAVSVSKNALDMLKLLGDALAHGPIPLPDTLHAELVGFLTDYAALLSDAFLVSANAFRGKVTDAAKQLADAMSLTLNVVKSVLEFNDLRAAIVSFKPLDMAVYGPKLDMMFLAVKQVAARFAEKAKSANISKDMQDAADALSKVFGDAADSIKGALDMAAQLLDPETQIPSIGQLDAKLTAILNLIEGVTLRFADKAASIGPDTAKSAEGLSSAVKSVFDAISQVIAAVKDAGDLYLGTAGFNNIAALMTYLFDTFDQFAGRSEGVNAVTAAITSLLGGIQALVSDAGFTAGQTWAQQFAAGIAAAAGNMRVLPPGGAAAGGGAAATVTNITNNNQRYVTINSVINVASTQESERALGGIYSLVTMFG